MIKKIGMERATLLACGLLLSCQQSFAATPFRNDSLQMQHGFYSRVFGGINDVINDGEALGVTPTNISEDLDVEYNKGFNLGAALGYKYG